ncbi:PilW family protein [Clostridium estertheticum]|uniref:PilW family protein n=1 Tax=Clostridium estertheticum TaxID=238834 RepID=UPI001C0AAECE|nr:type II secretion system protein [Clostridium estertheticum]MBU3183878.1 type II secretion system GspH family protein [Clostridium estertheticum]
MKVGNPMNNNLKKKGFTLVEIIVVIAIMGIVFSMIFQVFSFQTKIYKTEVENNDAQNSGRLCLTSISEGIRLASLVTVNDPNVTAPLIATPKITGRSYQIVWITPYGGTSSYQYIINDTKLYKYVNDSSYYLIASKVKTVTVIKVGSVYAIRVEIFNGSSINSKIFTTSISIRNRGL